MKKYTGIRIYPYNVLRPANSLKIGKSEKTRPCSRKHGLGFLRVIKKMSRVKARIAFALIPLAGILLAMTAFGLFSPTMCICQQQSCGSLLEPSHAIATALRYLMVVRSGVVDRDRQYLFYI